MTPEEFQQQYMPYAQSVSQRTGLDPRLVLAQAALETGYGRSAPNNNFFGIKSHGKSGGSNLMTQEFEGGQMVSKPQSFRGYEGPEQSFQGYADFILDNPRYGDVLAQGDLAGQIGAMGRSGYATDPNYASKLSSIASRFGGENRAIAADTMRALGRQPSGGNTRNAQTPNTNNAQTGGILSNEGNQMAQPQQPQRPQGLLSSLGVQRRDPNAQGETSQPFYNRQSFGNTLARMAPALGRMGVMGLEGPAQAALDTRNERQSDERAQQAQAATRNQTIEWLVNNGREDLAGAVQSGGLPIGEAMSIATASAEGSFTQVTGADLGMTGESANQTFNVGPDGKVTSIGGGAPVTNINNNMGPDESEFNKETGKILAQEANTIVEQGSLAQRSIGQIDTLEQALLNAPAGAEGSLVNFAANIGIKMEGSSNIELANAIISQLVPAQRPPGSGVMSDADLALFKASLPRLINTREGNQLIINTIRNVAQYDMQRGEIARGLQLGRITPEEAATQYQGLGNPLSGFQNQGGATPPPAGGGDDLSGMSNAELQAIIEAGQ
jgi:hypothetical protein